MDRRWTEFGVPCHDDWLELQPGGQAEAIVIDFEEVESGVVQKADGNIASPSQKMSL